MNLHDAGQHCAEAKGWIRKAAIDECTSDQCLVLDEIYLNSRPAVQPRRSNSEAKRESWTKEVT